MKTKTPFRIAFCGRSGSGKDAAADYMARHYIFRRFALADPVKAAVTAAFPHFNFAKYGKNEPIIELGGWSQRELFQTLGTEWGRNMVSRNMWVDGLMRRIHHADAQIPNYRPSIVVTDVRRHNEGEALRASGFTLILNQGSLAEFQSAVIDIVENLQVKLQSVEAA